MRTLLAIEKSGRNRGVLACVTTLEATSETVAVVLLNRTCTPNRHLVVDGRCIDATRDTALEKNLEAILKRVGSEEGAGYPLEG